MSIDKRFSTLKFAKFVFANTSGGIVSELILSMGLLLIFGSLTISGETYSSPVLLGLNIIAQGVGIAFAFFINEHVTVHVQEKENNGGKKLIIRLLKFEGLNFIGASIGILVQLTLLKTLTVSPVLGNIVGVIVAYPIMYLVSMRYVWRANT